MIHYVTNEIQSNTWLIYYVTIHKCFVLAPWCDDFRLLIIFCLIHMLNYVDRGAIASNGVNGSLAICTDSGICRGGSGIQ